MIFFSADIYNYQVWILFYVILFFRYFIIAGAAYLIFWKTKKWQHLRIQNNFPRRESLYREFFYSLATFVIFVITGISIIAARQQGHTFLYDDIGEYGWGYFSFSVILSILIHDTYFYWAHRFMHIRSLYPFFHKVHHLSVNPSPWAAFSFHPLESVMEALILPILVMIMPLHPLAIFIFLLFMTVLNVQGHLGYELFPSGFTRHKIWKWMNTSTHHNMHHKFFSCNYGLYFNWWDRIMQTNHAQYHEYYEKVKSNTAR